MHILNTSQRHAISRAASRADSSTNQRESDQDAYRRFEALLSEPPRPGGVAMPAPLRTRSGRARLEVLHFRLTNGPLADLEIEARTDGEALSLRVTVRDLQHFERTVGDRKQLASALAQQFARPVLLEVLHADSTAE